MFFFLFAANENVEGDAPSVDNNGSNNFEIYAIISGCVGLLFVGILIAQKKCRKGYNKIIDDTTKINDQSKQTQEYQA